MKKANIQAVSIALRIYFLANALIAAICLLVLLWIPTDPKNVWLIGYSKNRLALIVVFIFFILLFAYLAVESHRLRRFNEILVQKAIDVVTEYRLILLVMLPFYGLTFILVLVYFSLQIRYLAITTYQVVLDRLLPLILFGLSLFLLTYLVVILISTRFPISKLDSTTMYINPKKVFVFLMSMMVLLILVSTLLNLLIVLDIPVFHLTIRIFDLNAERNIPTLFSSVILLGSSILLGFIAFLTRSTEGPYSLFWAVLSLGFLFLSIDETAFIHENLSENIGGWIFVATPFVILFLLGYIRFFLHLPRSTKLYFLFAGLFYIGGAFIIEFIGSWRISISDENIFATTIIFSTVEETLEMFGINLFIYSLLLYLRDNFPVFYLSFQNPNH
jgi:hypothetical protein